MAAGSATSLPSSLPSSHSAPPHQHAVRQARKHSRYALRKRRCPTATAGPVRKRHKDTQTTTASQHPPHSSAQRGAPPPPRGAGLAAPNPPPPPPPSAEPQCSCRCSGLHMWCEQVCNKGVGPASTERRCPSIPMQSNSMGPTAAAAAITQCTNPGQAAAQGSGGQLRLPGRHFGAGRPAIRPPSSTRCKHATLAAGLCHACPSKHPSHATTSYNMRLAVPEAHPGWSARTRCARSRQTARQHPARSSAHRPGRPGGRTPGGGGQAERPGQKGESVAGAPPAAVQAAAAAGLPMAHRRPPATPRHAQITLLDASRPLQRTLEATRAASSRWLNSSSS